MLYNFYGILLESDQSIPSFEAFKAKQEEPFSKRVVLTTVTGLFCETAVSATYEHRGLNVSSLADGWLFSLPGDNSCALAASRDYLQLTAYVNPEEIQSYKLLPLLRTALECAAATQGLVSLHASCLKLGENAVCLTASSGTGKSTRAQSWVDANGAELISGDRPVIRTDVSGKVFACGAPWDGKEQIFVNDSAELKAVCDIRRGDFVRARRLSANQARRVLLQQCFIPMWDTAVAAQVMATVSVLSKKITVLRTVCGPDERSARMLKEIVFDREKEIYGVEKDMKAKSGFVLKNIAGESIIMPVGDNIKNFDGAIVLNGVSAFVWSKLENGASRDELVEYILAEYDVDADRAAEDLDLLLKKLIGYGAIEEEAL